MAHAPALLRTNTAPVFTADRRLGGMSSGVAGPRASSQLSGSTMFASTSNPSLASVSTATTLGGNDNGPVMATGNIINQKADASRSLYQICASLKQRLQLVPGFEQYQQELDELTAKSDGGPVDALWNLLRTGHPLLTVFNSLQPERPLNVGGVPGSEAKVSKIAVFRFVEACLQQLNMKSGECFVINDLMGNDTTGFVRVIQVVNNVLDVAQSQGRLLEPLESAYAADAGAGVPGMKLSYRDHIIKEMVDTERKYVQDLENLHDLKKALEQQGIIPGDIVHHIFLNINAILDFQRRFLIRVETTNSMPQDAQRWGAPFATYEEGFKIYQPFIANQRKAAQVANQVFEKIQVIQHPVACDFNTLDGFLLKPMQRLVKYPLLLKDLLKKSEDPDVKQDLATGIAAAERVLSKANEAVNRDLLDEAVEDLNKRVDDWKNHKVDHFGSLLRHGVYTVITGRSDQEKDYEIYLFESILLCCKEVQPNKNKDKKDKTKSNVPKPRNKNNKLQLKGRIFMTNVTEVLSFAKPGSYTVQIWWKGDPGVENFVIKFTNEEQMKKWATGLDNQRKLNAPSAAASPSEAATDFAWMRNAEGLENPYKQQEESDDDDETPMPGPQQMASPNIGYGISQQSTGGVMTRNASSTSLRTRSTTGESTQSLAGIARAPPPRFPLPAPPSQLSLQTQGVPPGAGSPGPRGGDSYFSPATESPVSTRTSTASSMHFSSAYPFPKTGTPQGWEDSNRYTAPAMPRAPSRDGSSPVNTYTVNGRNPRGPSMPVMASQQSLAQQQRNRSYSTPDINGQANGRRSNSSTPVPAVPGIPSHLHDPNIPRSQNGSPMPDVPIRTSTQSPGAQRTHQSHGSLGGQMGQFPAKPIYAGRSTPAPAPQAGVPPPLQLDNRSAVSPALGTASNPLFSPAPDSMPTQLKVKVNCDSGNYITLVVAFNITYQSMIDRIDAKLSRFTDSSIGKGNLKLRYRDEDGDFVNIESDEDIQIAFLEHREGSKNQYNLGGVGEIELFCVGDM
ncbi:putative Pleckstrin-like protein [Seiridium unicorne]|uniref:Pleckstrin-like protein n=1 Tax=Seiridium unicorne TaxID=138068 RepID=A0ABR2UJK8_9PEZI